MLFLIKCVYCRCLGICTEAGGLEVIGYCELPDVGAGNQTQILCKKTARSYQESSLQPGERALNPLSKRCQSSA